MAEMITDAKGRKIGLRKINVRDQFRLLRALGKDSENQPVVQFAMVAASVAEIDGVPLPFPRNMQDIEATIDRLDDAGFAALLVHIRRETEAVEAAAQAAMEGQVGPLATSA